MTQRPLERRWLSFTSPFPTWAAPATNARSFASWKQMLATWPHIPSPTDPINSTLTTRLFPSQPFQNLLSLRRLHHRPDRRTNLRKDRPGPLPVVVVRVPNKPLPWRPTRPGAPPHRRLIIGRGRRTRCSSAPWRCTTRTPQTGGTTWRATWAAPGPSRRCAAATSCSSGTSSRSSPTACRSTGTPPHRRRRDCSEVYTGRRLPVNLALLLPPFLLLVLEHATCHIFNHSCCRLDAVGMQLLRHT